MPEARSLETFTTFTDVFSWLADDPSLDELERRLAYLREARVEIEQSIESIERHLRDRLGLALPLFEDPEVFDFVEDDLPF